MYRIICLLFICAVSHFAFGQNLSDYSVKGDVSFAKNDFQAAFDYYSKAIDTNSSDKVALARIYYKRSKCDQALQHYGNALFDLNAAISLDPKFRDAYTERGVLYQNKYFYYRKSARDYQLAIQLTDTKDRHMLATLYTNFANDAVSYGKADSAIHLDSIALQYSPFYYSTYYSFFEINIGQKNYAEAVKNINSTIEYGSHNLTKEQLLLLYRERADAKRLNKDYKGAINDYSLVLKVNPDDGDAYWNRGAAYYMHSDYELAVNDYTKAINYFQNNDHKIHLLYIDRAVSEIGENKPDLAIKDANEAIRLFNQYGPAYIALGNAYLMKGDFKKSADKFIIGEKYMFGNAPTSHAYSSIAKTEYFLNKYNKTILYADTAFDWDTTNCESYFYRAKTYWNKLNKKDAAIENFNKVLALDTTKSSDCYIFSQYYLGKADKAVEILQDKILKTNDDSQLRDDYYQLACLYSLMNKPDDSNNNLKIAIDKGYAKKYAAADEDLNNIRNTADYKSIISDDK